MKVVKEKNTMENTKKDWIITHTKSEDACVEIKRFFWYRRGNGSAVKINGC